MKTYDVLHFGFSSLTQRKLRSWLTVLGIVIGVASIVALISIGEGAQAQISNRLGGLGADVVTVTPGFQRASGRGFFGGGGEGATAANNLTLNDVRAVKTTQGVLYAAGVVSGRVDVSFSGQTATVSVQGVDTTVWRYMIGTPLANGQYLSAGDAGDVVIGNGIANSLFKTPVTLNSDITIGGRSFKVTGILQQSGFGQGDSVVYISDTDARSLLDFGATRVSSISAKVDATQVQDIANAITNKLLITRHVQANTTQDFTVSTVQGAQSQISSVTSTFTLFLAAVAGISLLVGAIGISNTMFTSVTERTRQIGILKSLGATDGEVMKIFISEAAFIGLLGGFLGVFAGIAATGFLTELGVRIGFQGAFNASVSPTLIVFSIAFSIIVGALSGFLPARAAARLQPVEALRYE